jgi:hypothetical protein
MKADLVKIVRLPVGEAPEWVRAAWVGMTLPLVRSDLIEVSTVGVMTGPTTRLGHAWARLTRAAPIMAGYQVNAKTAVDLLAATAPTSADWWRNNVPHLLDGQQTFLFDKAACDLAAADRHTHWNVANDGG